MKLSVNEAELTGLRARNCATIQQVLIIRFAFRSETLPGLSRNESLVCHFDATYYGMQVLCCQRPLHSAPCVEDQKTELLEGNVTRHDSQRRFSVQRNVATTLLRHYFEWLQHSCKIPRLFRAKKNCCESSRATSP